MPQPDPDKFETLIPELADWRAHGLASDPETWICSEGSYALAVGYSLVFWPGFVVIEDYVLRDGATESNLRQWQAGGYARASIEAVMNHLHIADIHTMKDEPSEAQARYLGRVLEQIHRLKLAADFPDRRFVVSFNDEPGLDIIDYQLTFFQAPD